MQSLMVGNLPRGAEEEDLKRVFNRFGEVVKVTIIPEVGIGRSVGLGFVDMAEEAHAVAAVQRPGECRINGTPLMIESYFG